MNRHDSYNIMCLVNIHLYYSYILFLKYDIFYVHVCVECSLYWLTNYLLYTDSVCGAQTRNVYGVMLLCCLGYKSK